MNAKSQTYAAMQTVRVTRWFWPWQDEAEEAWLSEMSAKGLHLAKPDLFGQYTFTRGKARETIYRLDYRGELQSSLSDYIQLFKDAGWEHVGVLGGWQYFRRRANPDAPAEIFTDVESKMLKYKRLRVGMSIPIGLCLYTMLNLWLVREHLSTGWLVGLEIFFLLMLLLVAFMVAGVSRRVKELRS
jgi:hypothetical protein